MRSVDHAMGPATVRLRAPEPHRASDPDGEALCEPVPLTREEAARLTAAKPSVSTNRLLAAQAVVGVVCAAVAWFLTSRDSVVWSALHGAAVVVIPNALLAFGLRRARGQASAVMTFLVWEMLKIAVGTLMLVAAAVWAPALSWPAMLVTMIVCMKMGWLALLMRRRSVVSETTKRAD